MGATPSRRAVPTSKGPTSADSLDASPDRRTETHTAAPTRRAESRGETIRSSNIWRIRRSTSREQRWFLRASKSHRNARTLLHTLSPAHLHRFNLVYYDEFGGEYIC